MCPACDIAIALSEARAGGGPPLLALVKEAQAEVAPAGSSPSVVPDVPEPDDDGPLYAARRRIYPQRVKGTFRRLKWIILGITLGIYYLLPFVRWDRGPDAA